MRGGGRVGGRLRGRHLRHQCALPNHVAPLVEGAEHRAPLRRHRHPRAPQHRALRASGRQLLSALRIARPSGDRPWAPPPSAASADSSAARARHAFSAALSPLFRSAIADPWGAPTARRAVASCSSLCASRGPSVRRWRSSSAADGRPRELRRPSVDRHPLPAPRAPPPRASSDRSPRAARREALPRVEALELQTVAEPRRRVQQLAALLEHRTPAVHRLAKALSAKAPAPRHIIARSSPSRTMS